MALLLADTHAHPTSLHFYSCFPAEPIPGGYLVCSQRRALPGMTLLSLLQGLAAHGAREQGAVVVCHGNTRGLALPLVPGGRALHPSHLETLMLPSSYPPDAIGAALGLPRESAALLRQARDAVLARGVGHVALRACNVGHGSELDGNQSLLDLSTLRRFLGARRVCAPTLLDAFAAVRVIVDPAQASARLTLTATGGGFQALVYARDPPSLHAWQRASFPPPHHLPPDDRVPLHAMLAPRSGDYDVHLPTGSTYLASLRSDP